MLAVDADGRKLCQFACVPGADPREALEFALFEAALRGDGHAADVMAVWRDGGRRLVAEDEWPSLDARKAA